MRIIDVSIIKETVATLCKETNYYISPDIKKALIDNKDKETNSLGKDILGILLENAEIAAQEQIPICQDTGMAVVFIKIGQEVNLSGGSISTAINEGIAKGYQEGFLRKSIVKDPIDRINTNDNTPAIIHYEIVDGNNVEITVAPKGFGSENMSKLKMLKPSDGIKGVKAFIIETVKEAGGNPCPPIIVGVGIGGTIEKCTLLAKQALLREVGTNNVDNNWNSVEQELLDKINQLNIGPAGLGGITTALAVHINTFPTHIAGLPVAVNMGCHATRHKTVII